MPFEDDELDLDALQLPQLTLTRTSGFNTFSYGNNHENLPPMEFIGIGGGIFKS
jgi:hypothetical protein